MTLQAYCPPSRLREAFQAAPDERVVQGIWFEQYIRQPLTTDDGRAFTIVQPGYWNHGAGPDFELAALRDEQGELRVGPVEIHLRATDWENHGHHTDPAYDATILHVVWEPPVRRFFPATASFRSVPQVILRDQLAAPLSELMPHLAYLTAGPLPAALPGRCRQKLAGFPEARVLAILRAAGRHRLEMKSQRWALRERQAGRAQTLWEFLAEGLGYSRNKAPFRLLARRLPYAELRRLAAPERLARLFGVAGFLPHGDLASLPADSRAWVRPVWEVWWKLRDPLAHAILPKHQWLLAGIRPWNRPERRLAALHALLPEIPRLLAAAEERSPNAFARLLAAASDDFWEKHATLAGEPLAGPRQLVGAERIDDLLINLYWPMIACENLAEAIEGMSSMRPASNAKAILAEQRVLAGLITTPAARTEALIQQGLLQIYNDYCLQDASQCVDCGFPELLSKMPPTP
jgi:hypothetical protein